MSNSKMAADAKKKLRLTNPVHLLAVGLGSGLSPIMPGTMGSLLAIPIWWFCFQQLALGPYIVMLIVATILGVYFCQRTAVDMGVHDHGSIVWDEFVGMWITLMVIPLHNWQWIVLAFVLFRLFDMWKPWPIRYFDKHVHGGFGIMIDDVIAGAISALCIILVKLYIPISYLG
jgi:phosphatidylglycerophosphatase A